MKKNIIMLACLLLSMAASAQSFVIPPAPARGKVTKPEAKKVTPPTTQLSDKEKPSVKSYDQQNRQSSPAKVTMSTTTDLTAGKEVEGIERSLSIRELENRAKKGDNSAHTQLGMYYFQQDDGRALPHLVAGAKAGDRLAQYYLGGVYYFGKFGVTADKKAAASYYLMSAKQNHGPAQYGMALCLYNGEGVQQDKKAARSWMEKAARNKCPEAREFLDTHSFE
jgi:TPR repeat protein